MSKKKFTVGMESLFSGLEDDPLREEHARGAANPDAAHDSADANPEGKSRKSGVKNFSDDLQSFLQEAFAESLDRQWGQERSDSAPATQTASSKKRSHKPMGGLDSLLRSTIDPAHIRLDSSSTRRLTLVFDEDKLKKLKSIARVEKTYLRDIIDEIVADFIKAYEQEKGKLSE